MEDIKPIIESLLFVSKEPLTILRIQKVLPDSEKEPITDALKQLAEEYEARAGGFLLKEVAGGYQIRTRSEYKEYVKLFVQASPARLSKAAMETLAIIAWNQPLMKSDIEYIRGVDSGGVVRMLLERRLIRVLGRKEIPGRPLIYGTTKRFLEVFDLKNLRDLPTPKELEELSQDSLEQTLPEKTNDEATENISDGVTENALPETGEVSSTNMAEEESSGKPEQRNILDSVTEDSLAEEIRGITIPDVAENKPEVEPKPEEIPDSIPENFLPVIQEIVTQELPENIADDKQEDEPDDKQEPEEIPDSIPENFLPVIQEIVTQEVPEDIAEDKPDDEPDDEPDDKQEPEEIPDSIPENFLPVIQEIVTQEVPEDIAEDKPDDESEDKPEPGDVSDIVAENEKENKDTGYKNP
ncbi:SMC-Scp complex subunit ScpB [Desulfobacterales bacterium HSG16]|nr:SMC-Scp complex subunit ScpB [Desulfobacterales bacterium HSG16]